MIDSSFEDLPGGAMNRPTYENYSSQFTAQNYSLDNPQLFLGSPSSMNYLPQMGTVDSPELSTCLSSIVDSSGLHGVCGNLGSNQRQIGRVESPEYCEISSDMALNYISRMLMEEDIDEKVSSYQGEAAILAAEKPFYEILGRAYPPSPKGPPLDGHHGAGSPDDSSNTSHGQPCDNICVTSIVESDSHHVSSNDKVLHSLPTPLSSSTSAGLALEFMRGAEEANKFVPRIDKLVIDLEGNGLSVSEQPKQESQLPEVKAEEEGQHARFESRGHKSCSHVEDLDLLEGRSSKQSAVSSDEPIRNEMFDNVLRWPTQETFDEVAHLREIMAKEGSKSSQHGQSKGPSARGKSRGRKQQPKKEVVDLRTLLIHCAQAVATDDRRVASELLKQIRQHSAPDGDGSQRLAFYLADGLEARVAGVGSQLYHKLLAKRTTATDMLKAYRLYLLACPFKRASYYFSNQTILDVSEKQPRVHIIDFGIFFGFQWPSLIERLAKRDGGPPMLRITGIDVPQPGFRPTERIEETGRRLADYARMFQVPFQYRGIASKWETIRVEDLLIDKDEMLIVNCMFRIKNLGDETVAMDSPRDKVLNTIRRMNPKIFILGIINGSYSAPFFVTRFREVLFHYSSLFDMLDTNVPRDNETRMLIERDLFARDALNVIACEGSDRIERPESYRQWQVRNLRAGFEQLPVNPAILRKIRDRVRQVYHKDFVVDEDSRWLLQGWKGRIMYALSSWKSNELYTNH